jgi:hypothetical protein
MVRMAFNVLDTDRSGVVTLDEVESRYDASVHPEVKTGKKTKQQALREFMSVWDKHEQDGLITYVEFEDYYKEISASIDGDDYFELMIRNAWRIAGGKGQAANTANLRVLVTNADGSQSVQTVEDELGLRQGDIDGIKNRLSKQGVNATSVGLFYGEDQGRGGGGKVTAKPTLSDKTVRSRPSSANQGGAVQPSPSMSSTAVRSAFNRNMAAVKLAAVFRGNVARKVAAQERKKVEAVARAKEEEDLEANRPKPKIQSRPVVIKKRADARR